jgi:hypothetical protein
VAGPLQRELAAVVRISARGVENTPASVCAARHGSASNSLIAVLDHMPYGSVLTIARVSF